jgi:predicted acylesterase/phospholipase RssA
MIPANSSDESAVVPAAAVPVESIPEFDVLIMKGGGVKGLAFAGAIRELEQHFSFHTFVGTSAGAIAAALLASGATGAQLEEKLRRKSFRDFLDGNLWLLPFRFPIMRGVHPGYSFVNWLRDELYERLRKSGSLTMKDLPKRAVIYASSTDAGEITFDKIGERKDTAVHTAVRCSISIPYCFDPQWVDNHRVYDGGLLNNYPVQIFLDQERLRNANAPQPNFVALYLGSDKPRPINPGWVLSDLIRISTDKNDPKIINQYRSRTILIDFEPIGTMDFDLTDQEKDFLILQGRASALKFLADHHILNDSQLSAFPRVQTEAEQLRNAVINARNTARNERRVRFRQRLAVVIIVPILLFFAINPFSAQIKALICKFVWSRFSWCPVLELSIPVPKYLLCTGEYRDRCPRGAIHQPCGSTIDGWAKNRCSAYTSKRQDSFAGNRCDYQIDEVICFPYR